MKPNHNKTRTSGKKIDRNRKGSRPQFGSGKGGGLYLYGLHTVRAALLNPSRKLKKLWITRNASQRLELDKVDNPTVETEICDPRVIDRLVGKDAVHQGLALLCEPLEPVDIAELDQSQLLVVLDQITDPHNVGAILRSAVALGADSVITTSRHSAGETGVLAKSASGALDLLPISQVRNLSKALETLAEFGFQTIGLDSEGPKELGKTLSGGKIALVLGAEGKGLRQKTRETCNALARLELPGAIVSLNVSNAAAISLYLSRAHLESTKIDGGKP